MTELSDGSKRILRLCAEAMAERADRRSFDLFALNHEFRLRDDMVAFLTEVVQTETMGHLTVRTADPALFARNSKRLNLYLAVCPLATAVDMITELGPEITLYTVGPYDHGFYMATPAAPEAVARYRELATR